MSNLGLAILTVMVVVSDGLLASLRTGVFGGARPSNIRKVFSFGEEIHFRISAEELLAKTQTRISAEELLAKTQNPPIDDIVFPDATLSPASGDVQTRLRPTDTK